MRSIVENQANGPAATPAGSQTQVPADAPGHKDEFVTLAQEQVDEPGDDDGEDDAVENSRDGGESDSEPGETAGDRPKRRPGSARARDRIKALEREIESLRRGSARGAPAGDRDDDLVEPREQDFPNDYLAYDRALRTYETRKAIRDERRRDAEAQARHHAETETRTRFAGYNVRLEGVKDRIPDFDKVMASAGAVDIRADLRDLILDSPKGPLIAYHLAKNPERLTELNRMPPAAAAKEIGSLEARIRGPQPRTVTRARPAAQPPKGGTTARAPSPSDMSMAEYIAARKAGTI